MTKFGKIFCNLVANFKGVQLQGVQLSPLGFAACQSKNCTNKANSANYRRVWHPAIPTQTPNYLPTEPYAAKPSVCICEICGRLFSARSFCEFREFRGRTPRTHQTIFPLKPQKPQKFLTQDILPQNPRNTQKRLAQGILPQIAQMSTD